MQVRYVGNGCASAAKTLAVCWTTSSWSEMSSCDARILVLFSQVSEYADNTSVQCCDKKSIFAICGLVPFLSELILLFPGEPDLCRFRSQESPELSLYRVSTLYHVQWSVKQLTVRRGPAFKLKHKQLECCCLEKCLLRSAPIFR